VVVVLAAVEFVDRLAALEVVLEHEAGGFELGQHAVDRGQADVVVVGQQLAVDILGGQVATIVRLEDVEYAHARVGDFQSRLAKLA